jgi:peptide/nickel transport system substrate-binding protein
MESNPSLKVWKGAGSFIQYLVMQESIKPFDNPLIRRAIAASINRTAIVSTVFQGQAQPLYSIVPIGMMSHQDVFKLYGDANYTYTQQVLQQVGYSTRTILAQLGYNSTNPLVIDLWYDQSGHYPSEADIATVLKSSLEASGVIQVNLQGTDWATLDGSNLPAGNMPMFIFGWYPDYDDPNDYTYNFFQTQGSSWLNDHYSNPAADMVINQALASRNATERIQLYGQAQQILATDAPLIPLFQSTAGLAIRAVRA